MKAIRPLIHPLPAYDELKRYESAELGRMLTESGFRVENESLFQRTVRYTPKVIEALSDKTPAVDHELKRQ